MPARDDPRSRTRRFLSVCRHFRAQHLARETSGGRLYRETQLGAWATSRPEHLYYFFRSIELSRFRLFIDLGSGDGIVACIASLFTRAVGIEIDPELCSSARQSSIELGLQDHVELICGDFLGQRIRRADSLFIYPDKPMGRLEELLEGWKGTLLVYGPHLPVSRMTPLHRLACGRERLQVYACIPGPSR